MCATQTQSEYIRELLRQRAGWEQSLEWEQLSRVLGTVSRKFRAGQTTQTPKREIFPNALLTFLIFQHFRFHFDCSPSPPPSLCVCMCVRHKRNLNLNAQLLNQRLTFQPTHTQGTCRRRKNSFCQAVCLASISTWHTHTQCNQSQRMLTPFHPHLSPGCFTLSGCK